MFWLRAQNRSTTYEWVLVGAVLVWAEDQLQSGQLLLSAITRNLSIETDVNELPGGGTFVNIVSLQYPISPCSAPADFPL